MYERRLQMCPSFTWKTSTWPFSNLFKCAELFASRNWSVSPRHQFSFPYRHLSYLCLQTRWWKHLRQCPRSPYLNQTSSITCPPLFKCVGWEVTVKPITSAHQIAQANDDPGQPLLNLPIILEVFLPTRIYLRSWRKNRKLPRSWLMKKVNLSGICISIYVLDWSIRSSDLCLGQVAWDAIMLLAQEAGTGY